MSLGAPKSERGRSQSQGLLFRGDRQGVCAGPSGWWGSRNPKGGEVRAEAEDRRAAGRGQAIAVKRSGAREISEQETEINRIAIGNAMLVQPDIFFARTHRLRGSERDDSEQSRTRPEAM